MATPRGGDAAKVRYRIVYDSVDFLLRARDTMATKRLALLGLLGLVASAALANIPATPVMTLYRFNGDPELPYFELEGFERRGATSPRGRWPRAAR